METAKQTGRAAFGEMVAYLKAHPAVRVMLVEKTDRLYRNLKDWVTVDELEVEIHFLKENVVLSRGVPLLGKVHARHQGADGEELHRQPVGGNAQGDAGEGRAGHLAVVRAARLPQRGGPDGKKIIEPDPESAPIIAGCSNGTRPARFTERGGAEGAGGWARLPQERREVPVSTVHTILRNRHLHRRVRLERRCTRAGTSPSSRANCGSECRASSTAAHAKKHRRVKHDFAFSGLITCGHCGCSMVGEIKKQRYVYYHCTGYDKQGQRCEPSKYVREEVLEQQFADCWPAQVRRRGAGMGA